MENNKFAVKSGENEYEYIWRVHQYVKDGEITWVDLADMVNENFRESESDYRGESAYRKPVQSAELYYNNVFSGAGGAAAVRILAVSDLHVPFQKPVTVFEKYRGRVDVLVINGDVQDSQSLSRFVKTYRVSFMEEMIAARSYLIGLIEYIQPGKVIVTYGNHDERLAAYLAKNLDSDVNGLMPDTPLELIVEDGFNYYNKRQGEKTYYKPLTEVFSDIEIEYAHSWWCQVGKTIFCHPRAYSAAMMKTADKALTYFRNKGMTFDSLVMAHTHRIGSYKNGNTILFEQGCCCETSKLRYGDGQLSLQQQEGYLYLCQDKDGNLIREKTKQEYLNEK